MLGLGGGVGFRASGSSDLGETISYTAYSCYGLYYTGMLIDML